MYGAGSIGLGQVSNPRHASLNDTCRNCKQFRFMCMCPSSPSFVSEKGLKISEAIIFDFDF